MKSVALSILAATGVILFGSASVAEAGPKFSIQFNSGYGGSSYGYSGYAPRYNPSHNSGHCAPAPYKVRTVEVNRYTQCRTAYDHCGRPYSYHVTVVTYCDHYSNGATRTWTRTYS